ncbi:MAG: FliI/YscN family ATPase [Proteobacteria bacterium]|nr:FliI/YscN family ATPase [Pseudomonadota bacterium]
MAGTAIANIINEIKLMRHFSVSGRVIAVEEMFIKAEGLSSYVCIGTHCNIHTLDGKKCIAEVVAMNDSICTLMPFGDVNGVYLYAKVEVGQSIHKSIYPHENWRGRIINGLGMPIDNKGPLPIGSRGYEIFAKSLPANSRDRVKIKMDSGIRALNTFITCCFGQRLGIFSGSGVGKSTMFSMLAKFSNADVKVIGLIGERSREVREFIEDYLGEDGLEQSIVIVATADEPALIRRQAAYLTMTIAEFFRDLGKNVLCMIDNITRFAMAQREIGLTAGEPTITRGYTPSVFTHLPKLLERAGPGLVGSGSITAFFNTLVEGDDYNEPITDAVRGILDGHIILNRKIAEKNIYPAIDILSSISRMMPSCNTEEEMKIINKAKYFLSIYDEMEDMIRIGAYKVGSNEEVDLAIQYHKNLNQFISQKSNERENIKSSYAKLAKAIHYMP